MRKYFALFIKASIIFCFYFLYICSEQIVTGRKLINLAITCTRHSANKWNVQGKLNRGDWQFGIRGCQRRNDKLVAGGGIPSWKLEPECANVENTKATSVSPRTWLAFVYVRCILIHSRTGKVTMSVRCA